ncbi:acyl transferase/acyl hydrolase/lysophospholipase [Dichotomocladium elegans]|nr:acyl transferase/acyl hydrolase/lysophospholipase [Dichotomocladium elegans]
MTLPSFPSLDDLNEKIPTTEDINKKIAALYPSFSSQFDSLRQGYAVLWDYITMDDFRHMVADMEREFKDAVTYPEVAEDAYVRIGAGISQGEEAFLRKRKAKQKQAFADFIGVDVNEIDEEDIPVTAIASSGGGYRAMVGCAGYMKAMNDTGVLDLVTYLAGVSGSCWTFAQLYSPLADGSFDTLFSHFKSHVHTHLANVTNLVNILKASPDNSKILMQGIIERFYQQEGTINMVDVFGMMLGGTLLTKVETVSDDAKNDEVNLSGQAEYIQDGSLPMPIYCVVRHDLECEKRDGDAYQWFEFNPFEMGSEEINAWIPVWAFGRKFDNGKNTERLPEQTMSIMMGVFGSAFAASLAHFYQEIRTFVPKSALEKADGVFNRYQNSMSSFHPISPACFPNPFYNLFTATEQTPLATQNLLQSRELCLADAGLDNNLPFYPLLREDRKVDVIFAIDLSADIQTAPHLKRAEGYARRRGIEGWPKNAGWPKDGNSNDPYPLGTCTVFASQGYEGGKVHPINVVYFPLIINSNYDPEFDPQTCEFTSTWNFVYTPDQVSKLIGLAEQNWKDNVGTVCEVLKQVWMRKRADRLGKHLQMSRDEIMVA